MIEFIENNWLGILGILLSFFGITFVSVVNFLKETGHKLADLLRKSSVRKEFYRWTADWYRKLPSRWKKRARRVEEALGLRKKKSN